MRDNTTFAQQQDVEGGRESAPISVALRASDAILEHGINAYLTSSPRVSLRGSLLEADVSVLVLNNMDDEWLKVLKHDAARTFHYPIPVVIVANAISESQLTLAIEYGMTSFLPRSQTNLDQLVDAIVEASVGHSQMPEMLVFQLVAELRQRKRKATLAEVLQDSGMSAREVEVLRMLSEGMDTGEIAAIMSYSERTIKGIIHDVVKRWKLRNRTHAVAYAMRVGIL
ncbi:response regulator transcription factor [Streptomyces sp. NBC_01320]|uniref:response regulator transcription factor n=1 Tax=Streptomyces sp. NBC_01320 TaxID=2903824 RepID=UPI002E14F809|nr:LuxR C-terminal-related transcriptional regulator [Streptomyces sp. NBC_01320]